VDAIARLSDLRAKLGHAEGHDPFGLERIDFRTSEQGVHVYYFGSSTGDHYSELLNVLASDSVSRQLMSLQLDCPDAGANGTWNWDLEPLAASASGLPALRHLWIERGKPGEHNRKIVGRSYDEKGVIGRLIAKAPLLETLVSPSAPAANFFDNRLAHLHYVAVDAGYDAQGFIRNLAKSEIESLRSVEWGEYCETYMQDWRDHTTPFDDMLGLFRSKPFAGVKRMVLKNPVWSDEDIQRLLSPRSDLSLSIVRVSQSYVRRAQ
jgi:hypothetical protein